MAQANISAAAVKRAAMSATRASAKLEGRVVKSGFRRSDKVAKYLASRKSDA